MQSLGFSLILLPLASCFTASPLALSTGISGRKFLAATKVASVPLGLRMASKNDFPENFDDKSSRRAAIAVLTSGIVALMSPSQVFASGAGAWAKHEGPFADSDFVGFSSTASGLKFYDVEVGAGPMPNPGQKIKAHYSGYLLTGKKFDSSYDRGQPLPFNVGKGQVIKGWDEGLLSMKVGGKRILLIPAELAYGSRNVGGGLIPPNSVLVFYVELVTLAA